MTEARNKQQQPHGKPCLFLSNMPYHVSSARIASIMTDDNLQFSHVETISKGPPAHTKAAGLAIVRFDTVMHRDAALEKLRLKMLDGRAVVVSTAGFVEADEKGRPSAGSHSDNWVTAV